MRLYRAILALALVLAFGVIVLGAYVRLSDAGLGCPDWPGCYGRWIGVPDAAPDRAQALRAFPGKPVEAHKAWKEMLHRYCAGTLGLLIALIATLAWRKRHAWRQSAALPSLLLGIVGGQALLGMLTVTLLLKPVIVCAHLLGGMTTLALLAWLNLSHAPPTRRAVPGGLRGLAALALVALVAQVALGGWVSSHYAGLACGNDFPTCLGTWRPATDLAQGFQIHPAGDGLLSQAALTAIHWAHRVGALVVSVIVGLLAALLLRHAGWRGWGLALATTLVVQIGLGIANVVFSLPLHAALAHNAGAALLLTLTLALSFKLWAGSPPGGSGLGHMYRSGAASRIA